MSSGQLLSFGAARRVRGGSRWSLALERAAVADLPPGQAKSRPFLWQCLPLLLLWAPMTLAEPPVSSDTGGGTAPAHLPSPATKPAPPALATASPKGQTGPVIGADANQPPPDPNQRSLVMFFAIGAVINLLMISVLGVWAYRQLRKRKKPR